MNTKRFRLDGRARRGLRGWASVPHGHGNTRPRVCGLRRDGPIAPMVFEGARNGADFRVYVESGGAPNGRPGDGVILDPVATHQGKGVREAIAPAGATRRDRPADSPDFHPIELAFSKLKSGLRKASART